MSPAASRFLTLLEVLAFSAYVGLYIWKLQTAIWYSWIVFPLWLVLSFLAHGDSPKTIGWLGQNLWAAAKGSAKLLGPFAIALWVIGLLWGGWHRPIGNLLVPRHFFTYMAFCLLQQVGLNSYLTNRLAGAQVTPLCAMIFSAAIFAALHWPNPVLIPLTFIGGWAMAWLFLRERNIIPLAVWQGVLGTLVWWAFPVAWHHAMRVGPGFYAYHP